MKTTPKRIKVDWAAAQVAYDSGLSLRELAKLYNVSNGVIDYAVRQGKLVTRNKSDSVKLA